MKVYALSPGSACTSGKTFSDVSKSSVPFSGRWIVSDFATVAPLRRVGSWTRLYASVLQSVKHGFTARFGRVYHRKHGRPSSDRAHRFGDRSKGRAGAQRARLVARPARPARRALDGGGAQDREERHDADDRVADEGGGGARQERVLLRRRAG